MLDAFASLATLTASDRFAIAFLTVTNSTLDYNCTATQAILVTSLWDVTNLQASVANLKHQISTTSSVRSHSNHYCWICGQ